MFLTTCIIIPARSYLVNAFFEFFQNYLYKFPAGSCIRILGHRAVRLELLSHLFRVVPGAGRPARMDPRPAGRAERPEHRVQRQTVHPVRDLPDAACPGAQCAQVEETVSRRDGSRGGHHRQCCAPESRPPEPCRVCAGHRRPCGQRTGKRAEVRQERGQQGGVGTYVPTGGRPQGRTA